MSDCTHNCSTCVSKCGGAQSRADLLKPLNKHSKIKHVIAVMSGKGGVGKSFTTASIACALNKLGYKVGIMDADITGPSIPKLFGLTGFMESDGESILPKMSKGGIGTVSANYLVENESDPIIWRGAMIAQLVGQFWTEVNWGELDYLLIDMPPGTGDVPLTVFQSIKVDGVVIVTTPQGLVKMIVEKAYKMATKMDVPVLGLVENMSYFECPGCMEKYEIFGHTQVEEVAAEYNIDCAVRVPLEPKNAEMCDLGLVEELENSHISKIINKLVKE